MYSVRILQLTDKRRQKWQDNVRDISDIMEHCSSFPEAEVLLKPVSAAWKDKDQVRKYYWKSPGTLMRIRDENAEIPKFCPGCNCRCGGGETVKVAPRTEEIKEEPL